MNPFEQLTYRGQLRRIRPLAEAVLSHYPITVSRFVLIGHDTNTIYRVYAEDGTQYALRIARPGWRDVEAAQSEVMWLDALAKETDIPVPKIIRSNTGEGVVVAQTDGVPETRHALLMTWQPGMLLGKRLTEANLEKMGTLFGQLHLHGSSWQPPTDFSPRRFDQFLGRGEPNLIFAEASLSTYAPSERDILHHIKALVDKAYANLAAGGLCVIHCDLWHDNIKLHQGQLYPFDFEDTIWGYRLHDIAMAMIDLFEEMDMARYEQLLTAFRQGYEAHLTWPEGDLALLQIGRILWRINFIAHFHPKWLAYNVTFYTTLFERYLAEGTLIPPLRPT